MDKDKRIVELETALREADEIRHRMKEDWDKRCLKSHIDDLKAPCMVLYRVPCKEIEERARAQEKKDG